MALKTDISWTLTATVTNAESGQNDLLRRTVQSVVQLTNGTAAGKADLVYHDPSIVLGASASTSLDLSGSLTEPDGTAFVAAKVKALALKNSGAGSITLARPGSNGVPIFDAAGDSITIPSGGSIFLYNPTGWTVTASTGDLLSITADGSGATYAICIVATSA